MRRAQTKEVLDKFDALLAEQGYDKSNIISPTIWLANIVDYRGHSPVIVARDADVSAVVNLIAAAKFRNAGQVCVFRTRFIVHENLADDFIEAFVSAARSLKLGFGLDEDTGMGPLVNEKRRIAVTGIVADAVHQGAEVVAGGASVDGAGHFFEPTVLMNVAVTARMMTEEPFGPVAPIMTFTDVIADPRSFGPGRFLIDFGRGSETLMVRSDHLCRRQTNRITDEVCARTN